MKKRRMVKENRIISIEPYSQAMPGNYGVEDGYAERFIDAEYGVEPEQNSGTEYEIEVYGSEDSTEPEIFYGSPAAIADAVEYLLTSGKRFSHLVIHSEGNKVSAEEVAPVTESVDEGNVSVTVTAHNEGGRVIDHADDMDRGEALEMVDELIDGDDVRKIVIDVKKDGYVNI